MSEIWLGEERRVKPSACPQCGKLLDCATGLMGSKEPKPHDITICIHCAAALQFNDALQLRDLPQSVLRTLPSRTIDLLVRTTRAIKELRAEEGARRTGHQTAEAPGEGSRS